MVALDREHACELASTLARRVGARIAECLASTGAFSVEKKGPRDLVTEIDIWSEKQIILGVKERFPEHTILGEEGAATASLTELSRKLTDGIVWVVDPIDGTTNFVHGIPQVGVSIAILQNGVREVGVILDPARQELYSAIRGEGAYCNGRRIHVRDSVTVSDAVLATGFPYDRNASWDRHRRFFESALLACRDIRRFGAASLDQCWVACGRIDGFFEENLKPWDVAAGSLIVEEAGGRVGHYAGTNSDTFSPAATSFLFANPALYQELIALFSKE